MGQLNSPALLDDPGLLRSTPPTDTVDGIAPVDTADTAPQIDVPTAASRAAELRDVPLPVRRDAPPRAAGVTAELAPIAPGGNRRWSYRCAKRALDVVVSLVLLVLLSPLLLTVLAVLTVTTKGRPIFRQERLGLCGRPFRMYKFRTMVPEAERIRHLVANEQRGPIFKNVRDPRITRLGRILRSTSIDELPQLVNVLLGQMSLVGPRPPIASEVAQYEPWQRRRLSVKPGLTCRWQVSGRSEIGFDDWMLLDLWYVERQSLATDLVLLLRTPWAVLTRRGAY